MKLSGAKMLGVLALSVVLLAFYGCGDRREGSSSQAVSVSQDSQELPVLRQNELYKMTTPADSPEEDSLLAAYLKEKPSEEAGKKSEGPMGD